MITTHTLLVCEIAEEVAALVLVDNVDGAAVVAALVVVSNVEGAACTALELDKGLAALLVAAPLLLGTEAMEPAELLLRGDVDELRGATDEDGFCATDESGLFPEEAAAGALLLG